MQALARFSAYTGGMSDTVTLPRPSRPVPLAKKSPRLHILYTPYQGMLRACIHSLPIGEKTYIGRSLPSEHAGIVLDIDPSLSAEHACFEVSEQDYQVTLRDLGSKNGSWVETVSLPTSGSAAVVRDGEVIRLGSTFMLLRYEPSKSVDADITTLLGTSLAMRELRARILRLARETAPVLLVGETGTGKELAARALHFLSRRSGDLISRNCVAFPESLIESELFGHAEDAFTGAKRRLGAFRSADHGTLFLDEIGELPQSQQALLLRAIEDSKIIPVGADAPVPCYVRLITATNRDLQAEVDAGRFRQDLRARLAHLVVELPPLRTRREDILLLLEHFYAGVGRLLSVGLVNDLLLSQWKDNVRAIRAIADRLRIEGDSESLRASLGPLPSTRIEVAEAQAAPRSTHASSTTPSLAPHSSSPNPASPSMRPYRLPVPNREQLVRLLTRHQGIIAQVATELGCSRRQIQRWLELHRLDAADYRARPI